MVNRPDNLAVPRDADMLLRTPRLPTNSARDDAPARHLAWQHEMERAQLTGWFKSTPGAALQSRQLSEAGALPDIAERRMERSPQSDGKEAHVQMPEKDAERALPLHGAARAPGSAEMRISTATIVQSWSMASRLRVGAGFDAPSEQPTAERLAPASVSLNRPQIEALDDALQDPMATEEATADVPADTLISHEALQPVRLHEETTANGQAIWVAMHADDATLVALLPGMVNDLQSGLHAQGRRLHQVVCNGRLIWRDGAFAAPGKASMTDEETAHRDVGMFDSIHSKEA